MLFYIVELAREGTLALTLGVLNFSIGYKLSMKIPSDPECYRIMAHMAMLDNIVAHSVRVCQVATALAEKLNANGSSLDIHVVRATALLHDITKTRSLQTLENHPLTGERYLCELGYPEVGAIVGQHVKLREFDPESKPTAAEVLNYADKRVLHDKVVSLEDRMAYIAVRYQRSMELGGHQQDKMHQAARAVEDKLFKRLPFAAGDLDDYLCPEDFAKDMAGYRRSVRSHGNTPA